jgi:hypothetical protein
LKLIYSQLIPILCTFLISITCFTCIAIVDAQRNGSSVSVSSFGVVNYTSTPTPPPTPTPTSANHAVIPDFWTTPWWGIDGDAYNIYPVTWQGHTCIEIAPNPGYAAWAESYGWLGLNELDGLLNYKYGQMDPHGPAIAVPIKPGDHVVFSAWIWVEKSTIGGGGGGLMMALDIWDTTGTGIRITELRGPNAVGYPWDNGAGGIIPRVYAPWGSAGWTKLTIEFDIQATYLSDGLTVSGGGQPAGTPMIPGYIAPWFQLQNWSSNSEGASAYVYGTELYINPSE